MTLKVKCRIYLYFHNFHVSVHVLITTVTFLCVFFVSDEKGNMTNFETFKYNIHFKFINKTAPTKIIPVSRTIFILYKSCCKHDFVPFISISLSVKRSFFAKHLV